MVYCGNMENGKYKVENYKKRIVKVPNSQHIVVKNTHEAIISEETFETYVNRIKKDESKDKSL